MSQFWRVMRFENANGERVEVASSRGGPGVIDMPPGYSFVRSIPLVPCDQDAVNRAARGLARAFGEEVGWADWRRVAEIALRAAGGV